MNFLMRMFLRREDVRVAWMDLKEVEVIEELIRRLEPQKCLEWGAGYSTMYFSGLLGEGASWMSIEHDEKWAEAINDKLRKRPVFRERSGMVLSEYRWRLDMMRVLSRRNGPDVNVVHVPADRFPWTDKDSDGSYQDLRQYVDYPGRLAPFDLVLVDGRARRDCLRKAFEFVSERGVVLLHDAKREFYREACGLFPIQAELINHNVKGFGLWIGSKTRDLGQILDVAGHGLVNLPQGE